MKFAPPLLLKDKYYEPIEKEINRLFYEVLFKKLAAALNAPDDEITNSRVFRPRLKAMLREVMNESDPLEKAVRAGDIYFEGGKFHGEYNARTSKALRDIGAKFNPKSKTWSFNGPLPPQISIASADASLRYTAAKDRLILALADVDINQVHEISNIPDLYDRTLDEMEADFQKAMKQVSIPAKFTDAQKGILTADYSYNLDKYVKDWIEEDIIKLRETVQKEILTGKRSTALIEGLKKNYGVSQRKAKFLARQETALLMSKYRESRYKGAGLTKYKWSGSMDERERADHKRLEGQIFSWDDPPITNLKTGARNHPSEDFGCRCVAVPVIE